MVDELNLENGVGNLPNSMQALEINISEILYNSTKTETKEEI